MTKRNIEEEILANARQAEGAFDRNRAKRTNAIFSLIGDLAPEIETAKIDNPAEGREEDSSETAEEILASAELLRSICEAAKDAQGAKS